MLEKQLKPALSAAEFLLFYQPEEFAVSAFLPDGFTAGDGSFGCCGQR